jgi:hypothetical protein
MREGKRASSSFQQNKARGCGSWGDEMVMPVEQALEQARNQASMYQHAPEMDLTRMWEMYLQGVPKTRIAEALGIERHTVARHLRAMYREVAEERKISNVCKLDMAVARMRCVGVQAWADHDADAGASAAAICGSSSTWRRRLRGWKGCMRCRWTMMSGVSP